MKWEYRATFLRSISEEGFNGWRESHKKKYVGRNNIETLNEFGNEGWELVSVDNGIAYFKRVINEQKPNYFTSEYFDKINEMAMKQIAQAIVEVPTKQSYDD